MQIKRAFFVSAFIIFTLISLLLPGAALAQTYSYSLPQQFIDVYWNADGTSSIDYVFIFVNDPSGPTIEFVDVLLKPVKTVFTTSVYEHPSESVAAQRSYGHVKIEAE